MSGQERLTRTFPGLPISKHPPLQAAASAALPFEQGKARVAEEKKYVAACCTVGREQGRQCSNYQKSSNEFIYFGMGLSRARGWKGRSRP
eukprot:scaffold63216_cov21-Tisochrysis_lutea.AAC.1